MRSYQQYCGLAKALDVVGDRWTLLIVRELLIRGACRYTDLRDGLPGIATNLLASRLEELEEHGIVVREQAPPPVAANLICLTPRGRELEAVLKALGAWGVPLLAESGRKDVFRPHWLALPLEFYLEDRTPDAPAVKVEIRAGDEPLTLEAAGGRIEAHPGAAKAPDLVLTGNHKLVLGLLLGRLSLDAATVEGLNYQGDISVLSRFQRLSA